MTCVIDIQAGGRTRRQMFRDFGLLVGAVGVAGILAAPRGALAANKIDPKSVSYQPTPKGAARCDNCIQWQNPDACKVVAGPIAPSGWCSIYMRKT